MIGRCLISVLAVCSGLFFGPAPVLAVLPFAVGEEIRYEVRWQMYKAGEAVVRVLPDTEKQGMAAWHFVLEMKSNPLLDQFFMVRDRLEGFVAKDLSGSLDYAFTGTGKKKKQVRVVFTRNPDRARYANFDEIRNPIDIPAGCFDPLSSYFKMRTLDLAKGLTLSFPVSDGKKHFMQMGTVEGKQEITLGSGTWNTWVVSPYVTHFSGVFEKSRDPTVKVWITDDEHRIPVRIRIRVKVGSIYFDLAGYGPGPGKGGPDQAEAKAP